MKVHQKGRDPRASANVGKPMAKADPANLQKRILRLQRLAGNAAVGEFLAPDRVVPRGGGRPLEPSVRRDMEAQLGHDFSGVRLHEDDAAARNLGAHAYTVGTDIVFASGKLDEHRLVHELVHVVQQAHGPVDGTEVVPGVAVSDPSDRHERGAEAAADVVVAGRRHPLGHFPCTADAGEPEASSTASTRAQSVQRDSRQPEEEENRFPRTQILGPLGPTSALGSTNFLDVPSFEDLRKQQSGFTLSMPKAFQYLGVGGPPPIRQEETGIPEHILRQGKGLMLKLNLLPSPGSGVDPSAPENQPGSNSYWWQMMQEQAK